MQSKTMNSKVEGNFWILVLFASAFLVFVTIGIRLSFGLFLLPYTVEFGSGREVFSFAMAVQNIFWGISSPIAGAYADKLGAGKIAFIGTIFYTLGILIMIFFVSPYWLVLSQVFVGIGLGAAGISIALGAVAKTCPVNKRSLALGMVISFGSFGQFALIPLTQFLIEKFGWVEALSILSAISISMIFSCIILKFETTNNLDLSSVVKNLKIKEILNIAIFDKDYILLTIGFFVCGIQIVFIATHLPIYINDLGLSPYIAAWSLALVGLFNIIGSFLLGWLGSFLSKKKLLAWVYLLRSIFIVIFLSLPPSETMALIFGAAMGLIWLGTIPLTSALIVVFYGPTFLSMLYGITFLSHQVGSFFGAWLGGLIYDVYGNYNLMWIILIISGVFAFMVNWFINEDLSENQRLQT